MVLALSHMLTFEQAIPCQVTGRGIGIIDFAQYHTTILDAVAVLEAGASRFYLLSASRIGNMSTRHRLRDGLDIFGRGSVPRVE